MSYAIRYTKSTVHIEVPGGFAASACPSVSRGIDTMGTHGPALDTPAQALDAAEAFARNGAHTRIRPHTRALCKNCEKAARRAIDDAAITLTPHAAALRDLPAGTDVAVYTAKGDTIAGKIVAGAGTYGMVLWLEGGARRTIAYPDVESFEYFVDETGEWVDPITDTTTPAPEIALGADPASTVLTDEQADALRAEPRIQCGEALAHNGVEHACARTAGHKGTGGTAHRAANGIEWMPGQTMPLACPDRRRAGGCRQCEDAAAAFVAAHAPADAPRYDCAERTTVDGIGYACVNHGEHEEHTTALGASWWTPAPEPVVARLDHTEPGHATVTVTGGHGRERQPKAWLAHAGGAWVLADDYDGASYSVTGPDPERAVRAWAVLLGLDLDDVAVTVEYAGGPVSPVVPEAAEPRGVTLEWVRDREEVNVFHAKGHAHDYRVTEHYDGASLSATLRGTGGPVETYRRRYTTRPGARRGAQNYEHRYGSGYVPQG